MTAPEGGPADGVGPWQLSIDLGTSRTRGAVSDRQSASLLELGSDGQRWMPSCVFRAEDGQILVGDSARRLAVLLPERFEPQARRLLGAAELFLGDGPVAVSDLVAAVLKNVLETASRGNGGVAPSRVLLTYPAQWGEGRKRALLDAAEAAGIPEAELVTEVEAAAQPALVETEAGRYVAVCDLGGARCEASVLLRTGEGFTLAGPPADRDPLGGDDIDERILSYFGQLFESERPDEWHALSAPTDPRSRRQAQELRDEVRRAKEALGGSEACELSIPGISSEVQLTRHELEPLTADFAEAAVDLLQRALDQSSVTAGELERLYLVGGSAGLPQVQDAIWRRLQLRPLVAPDPGGAVAIGACTSVGVRRRSSARPAGGSPGPARGAVADSPASRPPPPPPPPPPPSQARPDDGTLAYTPALAMALDAADSEGVYECSAFVRFAPAPGTEMVVQLQDDPARVRTSEDLAAQLGRTGAKHPDLNETWSGPVAVAGADGWGVDYGERDQPDRIALTRRYLVADGRALVATASAGHRAMLDTVARRRPPPPADRFEVGWTANRRPDWTVTEQLVLRRVGTTYSVTAMCFTAVEALDVEAWTESKLAAFHRLPGAEPPSRTPGRVCGPLDGEIVTIRWQDGGRAMRTKIGLAVSGRQGFSVAITLPREEQALFPTLVRHAQLHSDAKD